MHDAIEDRVGEGRVAEVGVPVFDRQLAGDHRRAAADTVVEELEQIAALGRRRRRQTPVVDHDQVEPGQLHQPPAEAAVGVREAQLLEQARQAHVVGRQALAAGGVGERAGEPGLAAAGGAGDQAVLRLADPVAGAQRGELAALEPSPGAVVDILQAGAADLDTGGLEQALDALAVAQQQLAVDQLGQALVEGERLDGGMGVLFFEGARHALQAQGAQLVEGGVGEHRGLSGAGG